MTFWRDVMREAVGFCRRHRRDLLLAGGLLMVPALLVKALAGPLANAPLIPRDLRDGWAASAGGAAVEVFHTLIAIITDGVICVFVARHLAGQPVGWRAAWRLGLERTRPVLTGEFATLLPALGFSLLFALPGSLLLMALGSAGSTISQPAVGPQLVSMLGFLGKVGFMMFLTTRFAFVTPVAAVHRLGGFDAYAANLRLLARHYGKVFAVLAPIDLVREALVPLVGALPGPLGIAAQELVFWLALVFAGVVSMVLYVRLRGLVEGYDADRLAVDLDTPPAPGATDAPVNPQATSA